MKHNNFPLQLTAGKTLYSGISECQRNKKQHGQPEGTLFLQSFVHRLQPQLAGTHSKARGTFTTHRLRLLSAKEALQCELVMGYGWVNTLMVWLWALKSSQTPTIPPPVDSCAPHCILEPVPWVSWFLQTQTPLQWLLCCIDPHRVCNGIAVSTLVKQQITGMAGNRKNPNQLKANC